VSVQGVAAGCGQQPVRDSGEPSGDLERSRGPAQSAPAAPETTESAAGAETGESAGEAGAEPETLEPELYPGTGEFLDREAARPPAEPAPEDGQITLNFEGQDIQEIVKVILGDILGESYVIAPGVSGQATFSTARPVTREQVLPVLEMLLAWNNAAMIRDEGRWNVVPQNQALPGNLVPRVGPPPQRGYEVRAVPLEYIAPSEMQKLLEPFARQGAVVSADNARGLLVLAGTPKELSNYMDTIRIFDVNWLDGMSVGIFPLQRVEADTVVEELMSVFGGEGDTPLSGMFRFVPMERLNAVLAITPQEEYLREAEQWVDRLDRSMGGGAGVRLYVYDVENVKAQDLADTLNDVFSGSGGGRSGSRTEGAGRVAPGLEPVEIRAMNDPRGQQEETARQPEQPQRGGEGDGLRIVEGEEIRITAVEENNSLLIRSTPAQYEAILGAIKRLDTIPLQVLVEAKIVEVTLSDNLRYGVQWYFENAISSGNLPGNGGNGNGGNGGSAKGLFERDSQSGAFGSETGGLSYSFTGPNAQAILSAVSSADQFRVLSSPSLMVLNNKEANIQVGNQIPVVSTRFNPSGSVGDISTTSSVQFRDTGVILNVTPRVNPGGLVFLEISQELSEVAGEADATGNVPLAKREIDTELAVQSGETVVLGGLISDTRRKGKSGVPLLKDIPLLGNLFGETTSSGERQELLVVITPKVIRSAEQARQVTDEYRSRLEGLEPFDLEDDRLEEE
jgi:general secretion pathway protein D